MKSSTRRFSNIWSVLVNCVECEWINPKDPCRWSELTRWVGRSVSDAWNQYLLHPNQIGFMGFMGSHDLSCVFWINVGLVDWLWLTAIQSMNSFVSVGSASLLTRWDPLLVVISWSITPAYNQHLCLQTQLLTWIIGIVQSMGSYSIYQSFVWKSPLFGVINL